MNKKRNFAFLIACIACVFSLIYFTNLYAQPQGHERVVTPPAEKLESEGAKMVSGLKFKPLDFTPPKSGKARPGKRNDYISAGRP